MGRVEAILMNGAAVDVSELYPQPPPPGALRVKSFAEVSGGERIVQMLGPLNSGGKAVFFVATEKNIYQICDGQLSPCVFVVNEGPADDTLSQTAHEKNSAQARADQAAGADAGAGAESAASGSDVPGRAQE